MTTPRTPSLRQTRDTYVNLLLSTPPTQQPSWTPGQNLPTPHVHWASPVTPLSDNQIRVAEVAAELVAAGDCERRNKQALREMADKLERSERANRHLARRVRAPRRNIDFDTPNVQTRRRSSLGMEDNQVAVLRAERLAWIAERQRLSVMFTDIKRNTDRLLAQRSADKAQLLQLEEERERHLKLIAHLQQLHNFKSHHQPQDLPCPQIYQHASRNAELHTPDTFDHQAANEELRSELQMALDENAKFGDRNAVLQAAIQRLEQRLDHKRELQADYAQLVHTFNDMVHRQADGARQRKEEGHDNQDQDDDLGEQIQELEAEVDFLEAVSAAMQFNISPSDADRLQETLTQIQDGGTQMLSSSSTLSGDDKPSLPHRLRHLSKRLATIRDQHCLKYGRWLEAVANDSTHTSTASIHSAIEKLVCD